MGRAESTLPLVISTVVCNCKSAMAGPSAHSVAICMCVDKFKAQGMSQYLLDDFLAPALSIIFSLQ
jgi:hypothetical protein